MTAVKHLCLLIPHQFTPHPLLLHIQIPDTDGTCLFVKPLNINALTDVFHTLLAQKLSLLFICNQLFLQCCVKTCGNNGYWQQGSKSFLILLIRRLSALIQEVGETSVDWCIYQWRTCATNSLRKSWQVLASVCGTGSCDFSFATIIIWPAHCFVDWFIV